MIFTGDAHQIDLKFKNDSAIHDISKLDKSDCVYKIILHDNHRHESLNEILRLLNEY